MKKNILKSILAFVCLIQCFSTSVKAISNAGLSRPFQRFEFDGSYVYDFGLNFILSNDPNWLMDGNGLGSVNNANRRDRWTDVRGNCENNTGDNRGWSHSRNEWLTNSTYDQLYSDGYCEYQWGYDTYLANTFSDNLGNFVQGASNVPADRQPPWYDGKQDNYYRRPVLMIYRRNKPYPIVMKTYMDNEGKPTYSEGDRLWINGNNDFKIRTWGYDLYPNSYGANAQEEANIRWLYIGLTANNYNEDRYHGNQYCDFVGKVDGNNSDGNYRDFLSPWDLGGDRMKYIAPYWRGYDWNTRETYDGLKRNGMGAEMCAKLNHMEEVYPCTKLENKYEVTTGDWNRTFVYGWNGEKTYRTIKADSEAPTATKAYIANVTSTGYDVYVTGVSDNGQSGVSRVQFPTWTTSGWQDDIQSSWDTNSAATGQNLGNGTWKYHVNITDHNSEVGEYNTHVYLYDNVGNSSLVDGFKIDVKVNLKALDISILDENNIPTSNLIQNRNYKAKIKYKNDGLNDLNNFYVGICSNSTSSVINKVYVTDAIKVGQTKEIIVPFKLQNRNTDLGLIGFVDCTNIIRESNEDDNTIYKNINVKRVNIKALSINILDENKSKVTELQQNKKYFARINYINDGDILLENIRVGLYENNNKLSASTISSVSSVSSNNQGYIDIEFISNNRGQRTFKGILDDGDFIKESDEDDNETSTSLVSNKINVQANKIDIFNPWENRYVKQLIEGKEYEAHIRVCNDGDKNLNSVDIGLFQDNKFLSADNISLNIGENQVVKIKFTAKGPTKKGTVFKGFADCNDLIDESNESDNEVFTPKPYATEGTPINPPLNPNDPKIPVTIERLDLAATYIDFVGPDNEDIQNELYVNEPYRIKVKFKNLSTLAWSELDMLSKDFYIAVYDNDKFLGKTLIKDINKNQELTNYFNYIPTFSDEGTHTFKFVVDDGNKIPEFNENNNIATVTKKVVAIRLINLRIADMVNPPNKYTFPIFTDKMPADAKAGYKVQFDVDSIGLCDKVTVEILEGSKNIGIANMTKTYQSGNKQIWHLDYIIPLGTPYNPPTIINFKVIGTRGTSIFDYNIKNGFHGNVLKVIGNALDDVYINRIY